MRIKINTRDIAKKILAISCQLSAFRKLTARSYKLKASRGFTLIELLVTLSLFVILSGIVLFSQQKFNGSILLTNLAYDVALTIRQAQTFGINVRETSSGDFQKAYGVHFDMNKNSQFLLFSDNNNNGEYDGSLDCISSADTCVDKYNIRRGNYIKDICVTPSIGSSEDCSISNLDITFIRPDPDAIINGGSYSNASKAKIAISSADGANTRIIVVNSTGQMSIQK